MVIVPWVVISAFPLVHVAQLQAFQLNGQCIPYGICSVVKFSFLIVEFLLNDSTFMDTVSKSFG